MICYLHYTMHLDSLHRIPIPPSTSVLRLRLPSVLRTPSVRLLSKPAHEAFLPKSAFHERLY
jgi:hypothetical protein